MTFSQLYGRLSYLYLPVLARALNTRDGSFFDFGRSTLQNIRETEALRGTQMHDDF